MYRCLLRAICPARRPVTTPFCTLLQDSRLLLAAGLAPEINSRAYFCVAIRPCYNIVCWLSSQHLIIFFIFCLKTHKASSCSANWRTVPTLASSSIHNVKHLVPEVERNKKCLMVKLERREQSVSTDELFSTTAFCTDD
jgi:hypothetical protein